MSATKKLKSVRKELKARYAERSALVDGALTAILAGDHLLMLGPPGTAKSDFAEKFATCFKSSFFEIQLTKDTAPEEVFGMFSAKQMMENDLYKRNVKDCAPDRQIWFLDEIFKSSSALLNGFLLAMQQRKMRNGNEMLSLPLETVMAASNEYPEDASLDALYDRFSLKFWLDYLGDDSALLRLMTDGPSQVSTVLTEDELEYLRDAVWNIPWTTDEAKTLLKIKKACENDGFFASDRTWIAKAPLLVRARAVVNGHDSVYPGDFLVLADVIWKTHDQRPALLKTVGNASDPYGARATAIIDGVRAAMKDLPSVDDIKTGVKTKAGAVSDLGKIQVQLSSRRDAILDVKEKSKDNKAVLEAIDVVDEAIAKHAERAMEITVYRPVAS